MRDCGTEQQATNLRFRESGVVMQSNYIKHFKFRGKYYTTNMKRTKLYSMDDYTWKPIVEKPFWRFKMIIMGKVKRMKHEN